MSRKTNGQMTKMIVEVRSKVPIGGKRNPLRMAIFLLRNTGWVEIEVL